PHSTAALPHGFDREPAVRMENLRKRGEKKGLELLDRHHNRHAPSGATELADHGRMKKLSRTASFASRALTVMERIRTLHAASCARTCNGSPAQRRGQITPCQIACVARPWPASDFSCARQAGSCRPD